LDSQSELAITEAITELYGQKTIIIIAHRLTTVKRADCIYVMEQGRIVSQGTYDQLLDLDPHFRALALVDQDD
jgi:ABC-type multidrug transport system fused ATPase/permease subunit